MDRLLKKSASRKHNKCCMKPEVYLSEKTNKYVPIDDSPVRWWNNQHCLNHYNIYNKQKKLFFPQMFACAILNLFLQSCFLPCWWNINAISWIPSIVTAIVSIPWMVSLWNKWLLSSFFMQAAYILMRKMRRTMNKNNNNELENRTTFPFAVQRRQWITLEIYCYSHRHLKLFGIYFSFVYFFGVAERKNDYLHQTCQNYSFDPNT